jgi:hypothetical protein
MRTGCSNVADAWITVALNQIAPKDEAGKPVAGSVFSESDKKLIVNSLLEQCDAADGLKDGTIFNSRACHFNPVVLTCKGVKAEGCLTPAHVNVIQKGFAGPKNARGKLVYPGLPIRHWHWRERTVGGPNLSLEMDVGEAAAAIVVNSRIALTDTISTDLRTYAGHGGKLIFYNDLTDPWFSPLDTLAYYERLGDVSG